MSDKYGPDYHAEIGHKGGEVRREEWGSEGYSEMGRRGGEARAGPPRGAPGAT